MFVKKSMINLIEFNSVNSELFILDDVLSIEELRTVLFVFPLITEPHNS